LYYGNTVEDLGHSMRKEAVVDQRK
jgi:hypothetical protein